MRQDLLTIAATGTNGKTTTTSMVAAVIAASGQPWAMATTLGGWVNGSPVRAVEPSGSTAPPTSLTTFLTTVERAVQAQVKILAMEVTSLALARGAATRWPADLAIFTNLSRDHLDVHDSPEAYLAAKAQLFVHLRPGGCAVLNADDPNSDLLREVLPASARVLTFSLRDPLADLSADTIRLDQGRTLVRLAPGPLAQALGGALTLRTTGQVHVANALAAALATWAAGVSPAHIRAGLARFPGVPGRFEHVRPSALSSPAPPSPPGDDAQAHDLPSVVVDYAHTPDGLRGTLQTAQELLLARGQGGQLICVFGCGGQRDRGKRPLMAQVADAMASLIILTSDNPRAERPEDIAQEVLAGVPSPQASWIVEHDRALAIRTAIASARRHDLIVIAGKGHELYQEIADQRRPFSDARVARQALDERASAPPAP